MRDEKVRGPGANGEGEGCYVGRMSQLAAKEGNEVLEGRRD